MKDYTPQTMSKKKHRESMSGSPQSNGKHSHGKDRTRDYQNKSMTIRDVDRRASQGSSMSTAPPSTNRRSTFSPGNKKDPWKSLSETSFASASTQPAQNFPAGRPITLSTPSPRIVPSSAPTTCGRDIFSKATRISVPTDPRSDPAWIAQQMAKIQKQATEQPSFSAAAEQHQSTSEPDSSSSDDEKKDQAKLTSKKSKKNKKKNKKERREKKTKKTEKKKQKTETQQKSNAQVADKSKDPSRFKSEVKERTAYEVPVESLEEAERRKQKNTARREKLAEKKALAEALGRKAEGAQGATRVLAAGLKRKFDDPNSNVAFNSRLDTETQAIKRLRESLPSTRLSLVSQKLEQECGTAPTAMAVLVEAARETILDLARGQMSTMASGGNGQEGLTGAVLRMLNEQKGRLDKLESAVEKPKAIEGQVVKENDAEAGEDVKESDVESVHEVTSDEVAIEESSSSDSSSQEEEVDGGNDEDDSESESDTDTDTDTD